MHNSEEEGREEKEIKRKKTFEYIIELFTK
jgi:hypothetical protein